MSSWEPALTAATTAPVAAATLLLACVSRASEGEAGGARARDAATSCAVEPATSCAAAETPSARPDDATASSADVLKGLVKNDYLRHVQKR